MGEPTRAELQQKITAFAAYQIDQIAALTHDKVHIDPQQVMDRSRHLPLAPPTQISPNGQCRLVRCLDAWLAINLPRDDDRSLLPAWLGVAEDAPDAIIDAAIAARTSQSLLDDAMLMGLAAAKANERASDRPFFQQYGSTRRPREIRKIMDLSSLWAGPLCGSIWAAAGYDVVKLESITRPDPVQISTPEFDQILNGRKQRRAVNFQDHAALIAELHTADMVISSARPRAFAALGINPAALWARNPMLNWVAITGHGWDDGQAMRVGFGDDCAVAGGLLLSHHGHAEFLGDALADPLTGLFAAVKSLEMRHLGGAFLDISLAGTAAMARHFDPETKL